MYADEHAIIIVIFVIMLTGLVMSTLQATNPTLEMTIHVIFFTLWVHKTHCYFSSKIHGEGGWSHNFFQLTARWLQVMILKSWAQLTAKSLPYFSGYGYTKANLPTNMYTVDSG